MRKALPSAIACLLASAGSPAGANDPPKVNLTVGEKQATAGHAGMCDDLTVATIDVNYPATITALKPGKTVCSWAMNPNGPRTVVEVVVVAKSSDDKAGQQAAPGR